nr:MAG TPA: hypothetical protein [Inoviridae sp.]
MKRGATTLIQQDILTISSGRTSHRQQTEKHSRDFEKRGKSPSSFFFGGYRRNKTKRIIS